LLPSRKDYDALITGSDDRTWRDGLGPRVNRELTGKWYDLTWQMAETEILAEEGSLETVPGLAPTILSITPLEDPPTAMASRLCPGEAGGMIAYSKSCRIDSDCALLAIKTDCCGSKHLPARLAQDRPGLPG
jgi:hypothetical protein